jgi:Tfp pilus assembly protein PilX
MRGFFSFRGSGRRAQRGGLLITALLLMAVMAIALTSYLSLGRATLRMANRNFYLNGAVDLAETGIEQAMWAINAAANGDATAWQGWTTSGSTAQRTFPDFEYSGGVVGSVNVYVENYAGSGAVVTAKAKVVLQDKKVVEKWIQVKLKGRSLFEYGVLARDKISAEGGCVFDSWVSDPDLDSSTAPIPYSSSVAKSNGSIAAGATGAASVTLKPSAKVYGKVSVGTASGPTITTGAPLWGRRDLRIPTFSRII